jgi:hypothetical protein
MASATMSRRERPFEIQRRTTARRIAGVARSLDTGEIGEFPQSRRWRGVPTGVELGRDVGNFPTSFRAYITYAAD